MWYVPHLRCLLVQLHCLFVQADRRPRFFTLCLKQNFALGVLLEGVDDEAHVLLRRTHVSPAELIDFLPRITSSKHKSVRGDYLVLGWYPDFGWASYLGALGYLYARVIG